MFWFSTGDGVRYVKVIKCWAMVAAVSGLVIIGVVIVLAVFSQQLARNLQCRGVFSTRVKTRLCDMRGTYRRQFIL